MIRYEVNLNFIRPKLVLILWTKMPYRELMNYMKDIKDYRKILKSWHFSKRGLWVSPFPINPNVCNSWSRRPINIFCMLVHKIFFIKYQIKEYKIRFYILEFWKFKMKQFFMNFSLLQKIFISNQLENSLRQSWR